MSNSLLDRNSELEQENIKLKQRAEQAEKALAEIRAAWKTIARIAEHYA